MSEARTIYRIADAEEWREAARVGRYEGGDLDRNDGFLHLSTREQVPGTLAAHYAGRSGLVLLEIPVTGVESDVRWEESRGGALFPHLYRALRPSEVAAVRSLRLNAEGRHEPMP